MFLLEKQFECTVNYKKPLQDNKQSFIGKSVTKKLLTIFNYGKIKKGHKRGEKIFLRNIYIFLTKLVFYN